MAEFRSLDKSIKNAAEGMLIRDEEETVVPLPPTENDFLVMAFNSLIQAYMMRTNNTSGGHSDFQLNSPFKTFATQG